LNRWNLQIDPLAATDTLQSLPRIMPYPRDTPVFALALLALNLAANPLLFSLQLKQKLSS
jgi:hypothetical protein